MAKGFLESSQDPLADGNVVRRRARCIWKQNGKFIAAQPAGTIACAQYRFESPCYFHQQCITGIVSKVIVYLLEAIEIDQQEREARRAALHECAHALQFLLEYAAIGEARQRIDVGHAFQLALARA